MFLFCTKHGTQGCSWSGTVRLANANRQKYISLKCSAKFRQLSAPVGPNNDVHALSINFRLFNLSNTVRFCARSCLALRFDFTRVWLHYGNGPVARNTRSDRRRRKPMFLRWNIDYTYVKNTRKRKKYQSGTFFLASRYLISNNQTDVDVSFISR